MKKSVLYILGMIYIGGWLLGWGPAEQIWLPLIGSNATPTTISSPVPETLTLTPTPTVAQPDLPLRAAFYYPWYPNAWSQQGRNPFTRYQPQAGFYDSSDLAVVRGHIAAMEYGHIRAGIASWWGQGHHTDQRIPTLLAAATGTSFRWALYYELEAAGDPTVATLTSDLRYINERYAADPGYLRLDGKFVVFVYANTADGVDACGMIERWNAANTVNAYIVLKVFRNFRACTQQPQGWHQYAPAVAESHQQGYSFSISPGFWKADVAEPRLARDLAQWHASIRTMLAANEPFQLITTFNEWGEGTAVEAADEWPSTSGFGLYLDALQRDGEELTTATPTPTATPPDNGTIPTVPVTTIETTPVADAYTNSDKPTINYGDAALLRSDITPDLRTYLRFQVPTINDSIRRATVRLYSYSDSSLGYEIRDLLPNAAWDEATITYDSAPAVGYVLDSSGSITAETWSTVDVTRLVQNGQNLSLQDLNLVVVNLNDTAQSFASRESGLTSPALVIETIPMTTPDNPLPGVVVLAVGDIAGCNTDGDEAVAARLDELPGPILTLGDTVYESGTAAEFADCFDPSWGRHKARILPAVGNHEYLTPGAAPYYDYFGGAAGDRDKGYYSYDLGDWHIVALNTNCSEVGGCHRGSIQANWLRADLERHRRDCTLAYFHHPRWSSGQYQVNDNIRNLVDLLYEQHVDLMLSGHAHSYERFAPQDPAGRHDLTHGLVQFIIGTGGKNHRPVNVNVLPNSKVRNDDTFGVLKLKLLPTSYEWEFVPIHGSTFTDVGRAKCH